jgi:eukaryotic-like serine/threonine-protein kinase
MEFCAGPNLAQWQQQHGGKLSLTQIRPLLSQSLDALEYAHKQRCIHRDLKPQNLLVASSDSGAGMTLKIADFGLAHQFELAGYSGLTATGGHTVNYGFMPREVLTGFTDGHPASDLWSLAAVFYHLLTGRFPLDFARRDPIEVILHERAVPLGQREVSIPPAVAEVLDQALAADLPARYQSAREMRAAWDQAFVVAGRQLR